MKKHFLFLCLVLSMLGLSAQHNDAIREYINRFDYVKAPNPGQTLFKAAIGENDTLLFCVTDPEAKTVEVCCSDLDVDWHVGFDFISGDITIPETVEHEGVAYTVTGIGSQAFYFQFSLKSITLPNTITYIAQDAFACCEALQSINIPSSVTEIGSWAFYGCTSLTEIEIPASVTFIDGNILTACIGLKTITVAEGNKFYDSRNNCNAIMATATDELIAGCATTIVPENTKILGNEAFMFQYPMEKMNLPEGLLVLGEDCFCFTGLTSITIPSTVTTLRNNALHGCEYLTGSIVVPASVTEIGTGVFRTSEMVTSLSVDPENKVFDSRNNSNCVIRTDSNEVIGVCYYSIIPDGVKTLGENLISNILMPDNWNIPSSVTTLKKEALAYSNGIRTIIIPDSITEIGNSMFFYSDYEHISLPAGITKIGKEAFGWCDNLSTIHSKAAVAPALGKDAFDYGILNPMTIYIPCGSRESYEAAWIDSAFTFVEVDGMVYVESADTTQGFATVDTIMACPENSAIISATPKEGYVFSHWNDNDTINPRTVELKGDQTFVAYFKKNTAVNDYVDDSFTAFGANGHITVDNANGGVVRIYDITGRLICQDRMTGRKSYNMSQKGIYLVTVDNSPAKKVVVF